MKQLFATGGRWIALSAVSCALAMPRIASADETRYEPKWESLDKRPVPQWYQDAKFGIFIHWGLYSVPGWGAPKAYAEWYWNNMADKKPDNVWWQHHKQFYGENFEYKDFAPLFKAEYFNADQWADIFYRSGAKYIVPTSKHHEGFCLWPSDEANKAWDRPWNSVVTGPKRDLIGELAGAVRKKEGMKFGFYYSLYEWFNPLWLKDRKRYAVEHMHPQFKDVVTRYSPSIIFSDGEWDMDSKDWKSEELLAWLFNESPCKDYVVVDDRWGKETRHKHGTYFTTEYGAGMKDASHPWEESRGMGFSYGWNRAENADDFKSSRELVLVLCDLVSRGGNLLLDIGPTGDGRIPVEMQDRLLDMGAWLKVNGEAIYGTRYAGRDCQWTSGKRPDQGYKEYQQEYKLMDVVGQEQRGDKAVKQLFFTKKTDALYAITVGWPTPKVVLRGIKAPAGTEITLLGVPGKLNYTVNGSELTIEVPWLTGDKLPCKDAFAFKIPGGELLPE
jgi:alpha-L-fucosidase